MAEFTRQIISPKCISIDPPLSQGESVDLNFGIVTCNIENTINSVSIICNNATKITRTNQSDTSYLLNMKYGDSVCYNVATISNLPPLSILYPSAGGDPIVVANMCGCSELKICGATSSTINANLGTSSIVTSLNYTAPEPPPPQELVNNPISLTITNVANTDSNVCYTAKLNSSVPLQTGESFRLNYQLISGTDVSIASNVDVCSCAYAPNGYKVSSDVSSNVVDTCDNRIDGYVDITASNFSTITFGSRSYTNGTPFRGSFTSAGTIRLLSITNAVSSTSNFSVSVPAISVSRLIGLYRAPIELTTTTVNDGNDGVGGDFDIIRDGFSEM